MFPCQAWPLVVVSLANRHQRKTLKEQFSQKLKFSYCLLVLTPKERQTFLKLRSTTALQHSAKQLGDEDLFKECKKGSKELL